MMDYSSNLNLDLHHQEDFHGSSSSSSFALPWNHQDLLLNANGAIPGSSPRDHLMMPMVQDLGLIQWAPAGHGEENYNMMMNNGQTISESFAKLTGINLQDYSLQMAPQELHQTQLGFGSMDSGTGLFHPCPMGMDLQAMDLLASARFGRTMPQPSLDALALLRDDLGYGPLGQLQEANHQAPLSSTSYHKASHPVSGVTEAKRSNSLDSSRTSQPAAPPAKKPRFESRSSFTPFKVRKEKLGDRIAALQQLVAPFGKTDTASVLMEAIGYIKFLQDQVETLSVPYMRSSNNKKVRTSQGATNEERSDEPKPDLRSRGLCLVPLSCTSYVTNENAGVWSPPNYRGAT